MAWETGVSDAHPPDDRRQSDGINSRTIRDDTRTRNRVIDRYALRAHRRVGDPPVRCSPALPSIENELGPALKTPVAPRSIWLNGPLVFSGVNGDSSSASDPGFILVRQQM